MLKWITQSALSQGQSDMTFHSLSWFPLSKAFPVPVCRMFFLSGRVDAGLGLAWLSQQPLSIFLPGWTWIPLSIHKWSGSTSSTCWVCVLLCLRLQMNSDVVIHRDGVWIGPSCLEVKVRRAKLLLHLPAFPTTSVRINFFIKGQNVPFGEYCCFSFLPLWGCIAFLTM